MDGDAGSGKERDMEDTDTARTMSGFSGDMGDTERDTPSTLLNTSTYTMYDVNQMRIQSKQQKLDLQAEQDMVSQLRKRLNTAEKQRLEATSQHNKEMGSLENQLAKLRAQIEKGEATRHNIEFELTKAQREMTQQRQQQSQREASLQAAGDELKQKVANLTDDLKRTEHELRSAKDGASEQEHKLRAEVADRDHETARLQAELDMCRNERDRLAAISKQQEATIYEFGDKVSVFETEHKNQSDDLRRAVSEIKFCKEREDRLKKDLEGAVAKIKALEESVEAERAAHLESKFNSEIVQLRVRDLEGGIEVEKSANTEANRAVERLTKQMRELEQMYDDERKVKKDVLTKLDKTEKEYLSTRRQLNGEVEEKKTVIGSLSKELEVHQKNFNELKTELGKAKKRQAYLEDTYGTAFKELEFLLMNYDTGTDDKGKKPKLTLKKEEAKAKKTQTPSAVVESLTQVLMTFRRKLDSTTEELSKSKKNGEKHARELESCRDMIKSKDKSLEEAHKNYTRTAKELNKARASYGELEGMVGKLRSSLDHTASNQGKDRNRIQELSEEIMKLVKRQKQENEEKQAFLHGLYQRLLAGRVLVGQQQGDSSQPLHQLSWGDLTHMVYQQVGSTVDALNRAEEKLKGLTDNLKSRDEVVGELQRQHEEQLSRLTQLAKDRETSWNKQKEEMEQHYAQLLNDLQSRTKKSQAMADQAWEKMRATGSVQQGLEAECSSLRQQLSEAEAQARALLTACALLCGAVYPMYARGNALSVQRHVLEDQMTVWDNCRERARYLVNVLNTELTQSPDTPEREQRPGQQRNRLLQFRVGVIAVIAAHRLVRLGRQCCRCFVSYDSLSAGNGILVCTGGVQLPANNVVFPGDLSTLDDSEMTLGHAVGPPPGQAQLLSWLTSSSLADTVAACMADVTDAAHRIKDQGEAVEHRALVAAAKSSFSKLMDRLGQFFPSVGLNPVPVSRDRRSLAGRLGRTLARRLQGKSILEKDFVVSSQDLLIALQNHILDFTQRLHTVEVERRQLLKELGGLKTQIAGLGSLSLGPAPAEGDDSVHLVTMDKFERVCEELNEALKREQTAQHLLTEQSRQLQELTMRLDLSDTQGAQKQQTLAEAMTGLTELKEDSRRKDQEMKQCRKQIMQFEFQRKSMQANMRDAEDALRTAAKDKEILARYMKSVEAALEEAKKKLVFAKDSGTGNKNSSSSSAEATITLSKLLLNADLIPSDIGKAGPELIACQNLVGAFVDLHHQSLARARALEEETACLQQHVNSLKRELSDAVHREFNEQDLPTRDDYDLTSSSLSHTDANGKEEFRPLREDSEMSVSMTSMDRTPSKSAFKAVRSPSLQTPKLSSHKSRSRQPVPGHR